MNRLQLLVAVSAVVVLGALVSCGPIDPGCTEGSNCAGGEGGGSAGSAGGGSGGSSGGGTGGAAGGGTGGAVAGGSGGSEGGGSGGSEGGGSGGSAGGGSGGAAGGGSGGAAGGGSGGAAGGGSGGSAGGGSGGSAGGGTGGGSVLDGGFELSDGGYFIATPVPITFEDNCGPVTPQHGDEQGDWTYTGACVENSVFDAALAPLLSVGCSPTLSNTEGEVVGVVKLSGAPGNDVVQDIRAVVTTQLTAIGGLCSSPGACGLIPMYLPAGANGMCTEQSGGCHCNLTFLRNHYQSGVYTYVEGVLTSGNDVFDTFMNPLTPDEFTYRYYGDAGFPGVYDLQRIGAQ